jgi:glutathione S-transferase
MYTLRTSASSPFGRKVLIAAAVLDIRDRIVVEPANTRDPGDSINTQNPLGKIPTLLLENGKAIYDSRVIEQFLDTLVPGILFPPDIDRIDVLTAEALSDGMMDAGVLIVYESRFRPEEHRVQSWVDRQKEKLIRGLSYAEHHLSTPRVGKPHIAEISLACALNFFDFRHNGFWRKDCPKLVAWLEDFAARTPSYGETTPPD